MDGTFVSTHPEPSRTRPAGADGARTTTTTTTAAAVASLVGVAVFWCVQSLAASRAPGYGWAHDTISALASRGSSVLWVAVLAGAGLFLAHLAGGVVLWRRSQRLAGAALSLAAVSGMGVLSAPLHCPHGAAGCSDPLSGRGGLDTAAIIHRDFAVSYQVWMVLAVALVAVTLLHRRHPRRAVALLLAVTVSTGLALQMRSGHHLGVWERSWVGVNCLVLVALTVRYLSVADRQPRRLEQSVPTILWLGGLITVGVLLPVAALLQPSFSLSTDLVSDVASRGAVDPWVGRAALLGIAVAHLGVAAALAVAGTARRRVRLLLVAAGGAVVVGVCLAGVALVPIRCPRGAHGCNGPDSGRVLPTLTIDIVHRDLVAVAEAGLLVLLAALLVHLVVRRRGVAVTVVGVLLATNPVVLGVQQQGHDIGVWQDAWIATIVGGILIGAAISRHWMPVGGQARQPSGSSPPGMSAAGS